MEETATGLKPIKHILIVDDDEITRRLMQAELTENGFSVDIVSGQQEALDYLKIRGASVDVIVSDIIMPNGTGIDLLNTLIAQKSTIPFFLFSGNEDLTDELAIRMGASGFLKKPFKIGRLTVKIVLYFAQLQNRQADEAALALSKKKPA